MARTQLFISQITKNADVAKALKDFIEGKSLEGVEVFVSSDSNIQPVGFIATTSVNSQWNFMVLVMEKLQRRNCL